VAPEGSTRLLPGVAWSARGVHATTDDQNGAIEPYIGAIESNSWRDERRGGAIDLSRGAKDPYAPAHGRERRRADPARARRGRGAQASDRALLDREGSLAAAEVSGHRHDLRRPAPRPRARGSAPPRERRSPARDPQAPRQSAPGGAV